MKEEKIRSLIMSPVWEDVLIGISFLNGAYTLKDIKRILPEGEVGRVKNGGHSYMIIFPVMHPISVIKYYKAHSGIYMSISRLSIVFRTKPHEHMYLVKYETL